MATMKLYFLRHAEAEDGPVDAARELTAKGRRDARRVGRYLRDQGVAVDLVCTSPLVRAVQTAEIVLKQYPARRRGRLARVDALLNDTGAAAFGRWLTSLAPVESILLVGHEPSLSAHVRRLLGLSRSEALPLPKAGLCRVDTDDRRKGTLRLLIHPKQLP